MNGIALTRVWNIDGRLVVAKTAKEAIDLIKTYYKENTFYEPESIVGVSAGGSLSIDYDALIREEEAKPIDPWDLVDINTEITAKVKATGQILNGFYDGRGHFDHYTDHNMFDRYSTEEVELIIKDTK